MTRRERAAEILRKANAARIRGPRKRRFDASPLESLGASASRPSPTSPPRPRGMGPADRRGDKALGREPPVTAIFWRLAFYTASEEGRSSAPGGTPSSSTALWTSGRSDSRTSSAGKAGHGLCARLASFFAHALRVFDGGLCQPLQPAEVGPGCQRSGVGFRIHDSGDCRQWLAESESTKAHTRAS